MHPMTNNLFDFGMQAVVKPAMQPAWLRIDWRDGSSTFHNLVPTFAGGKLSGSHWHPQPFRQTPEAEYIVHANVEAAVYGLTRNPHLRGAACTACAAREARP